jgi:hypothetical protein
LVDLARKSRRWIESATALLNTRDHRKVTFKMRSTD